MWFVKWILLLALSLCAQIHSQAAVAADARPFVRESWQDIRARHDNRPLVVHLWGVTCAPCLTELPHWSRLRDAFPDMNLVFVAADPMPMPTDRVSAVLAKAGLDGIESWNFADKFTARLRFEIDPAWRGELPRTLLIDTDGTTTVMPGIADWTALEDWLRTR